MIREKIEALIHSGITAYAVSQGAGIPRNTVYRLFSGEASIDNITLKNAELFSNFYEQVIGVNKTKSLGGINMEKQHQVIVEQLSALLNQGENRLDGWFDEIVEKLLDGETADNVFVDGEWMNIAFVDNALQISQYKKGESI